MHSKKYMAICVLKSYSVWIHANSLQEVYSRSCPCEVKTRSRAQSLLISENSKCMEIFADFEFRKNFQISLLKTAFGGIPSLETNFGGIDFWMLAPVKSEKMSADFGGIARNFGGITRTQLQISTAHENSAVLKIVGNFFCFLPFCDSCAEMQFRQKFPKRIPQVYQWAWSCICFTRCRRKCRSGLTWITCRICASWCEQMVAQSFSRACTHELLWNIASNNDPNGKHIGGSTGRGRFVFKRHKNTCLKHSGLAHASACLENSSNWLQDFHVRQQIARRRHRIWLGCPSRLEALVSSVGLNTLLLLAALRKLLAPSRCMWAVLSLCPQALKVGLGLATLGDALILPLPHNLFLRWFWTPLSLSCWCGTGLSSKHCASRSMEQAYNARPLFSAYAHTLATNGQLFSVCRRA